MPQPKRPQRARNAAATRAAILVAARRRFAREGYDGASLRAIGSEAGVDAALVARYFGSKEELFREVLTSGDTNDMFGGDRTLFAEHAARMLVLGPRDDLRLDKLLMILRSISAPQAANAIRCNVHETFYGPIERIIGPPQCGVRARLVAAVITGFAINRAIADDYLLSVDDRQELYQELVALLKHAIEIQGQV